MKRFLGVGGLAAVMAAPFLMAAPAEAGCTRLAFSVNDYGKIGPTNDAKRLLDGHIAQEMKKRGISNYKTGKKTVTCELFLDVILFDEYTCRAEASVCWGGSGGSSSATKASAESDDDEPIATGSIDTDDESEGSSSASSATRSSESVEPIDPTELVP